MYAIKSIAYIALCHLMMSVMAFATDHNYGNLFDKASPFGVSANYVRLVDLEFPATWCALTDEYVCVISDVFVFSVPRNKYHKRNYWTHSGATYAVISTLEKRIRDEVIEYQVIRQKKKKIVTEYIYSDEYGVLAIKNNDGYEIMLMERCGFAARSNARRCQFETP